MPDEKFTPVYDGVSIDKFSRLLLQVWAIPTSLEMHLCGRFFLDGGETSMLCEDYALTGGGVEDEFFIVPSPGLLSGINVYITSGASSYGDVYVQLSMLHGFSRINMAHRLLLQGYIGGEIMRAFPCSSCKGQ